MEKPEDIAQDVWDRALQAALFITGWGDIYTSDIVPVIARAILSAVEEEREACAVEADKRADLAGEVSYPAAVAIMEALPDAIRNRKGA